MDTKRFVIGQIKYYAWASLLGVVAVFVIVQGWRTLGYVVSSVAEISWMDAGEKVHILTGMAYFATAATYLLTAIEGGGRSPSYALMAAAHVALMIVSTGGMYGLLDSISGLIPGLANLDILPITLMSMAILLLASIVFRRHSQH